MNIDRVDQTVPLDLHTPTTDTYSVRDISRTFLTRKLMLLVILITDRFADFLFKTLIFIVRSGAHF